MELHKSSYRIIKSQWGIAIDIVGEITSLENCIANADSIKIDNGLWIKILCKLSYEEEQYIYSGFKSISELIINALPYKANTLVIIHAIEYSLCDYQIEGLIPAIYQWVSGILKINIPKVEVEFNKKLNRYEFDLNSDIT